MMDNSGNLNSPNNIANVLDANRVPTNHVTVGRHLSHPRDAFVFYEARRYDIKGKKYLSTQAKHYVCDSGMRYAVLGTRDMDWGRMYENAAFLELTRRGYETYVGKLRQKEVDFVAKRGSGLVYIQAGDDISADSTLERELAPLLSVGGRVPEGSYRPHEARMLSWRVIIYFTSSPAQEYPSLGVTAVKEVPPSSMLNTRSSSPNPIRLTEQSAPGSTFSCT